MIFCWFMGVPCGQLYRPATLKAEGHGKQQVKATSSKVPALPANFKPVS